MSSNSAVRPRLWICEKASCRTRLFYPGPLCPSCGEMGELARYRSLEWPAGLNVMQQMDRRVRECYRTAGAPLETI
jgi:hypothetical protein